MSPPVIYFPLFAVFFAVGIIEVISIIVRPLSLSLRLFGNVFGGENLLHAMSQIQPWGLPIVFYFLELLIGFVQALVFVLLVSVYIGLICNHDDTRGDHDRPLTLYRRDRAPRADGGTPTTTKHTTMIQILAEMTGSIQGAFGCLAAAIGVGLVGAKAVEAVGRNPGASGKILVQSIIGMALAEAVAFYALFLGR